MALFGSFSFGVVMGWLAVLIYRPAQARSVKSAWAGAAAVLFGFVCASALSWFYLGFQGVLVAALGIAVGALTALALLRRAHFA